MLVAPDGKRQQVTGPVEPSKTGPHEIHLAPSALQQLLKVRVTHSLRSLSQPLGSCAEVLEVPQSSSRETLNAKYAPSCGSLRACCTQFFRGAHLG